MQQIRPVTYRVRLDPARQAVHVRLQLGNLTPGATLPLFIPTWVPGAYAFLRYARNIVDITATGGSVRREGQSAWALTVTGKEAEVSYTAFIQDRAWGELTGQLDHTQAILLGTSYLRVEGSQGPCVVHYELPAGWPLHHPSGAREIEPRVFEYPTYERMMDTPVVLGHFEKHTRRFGNTDFHFVFMDRCVGFDDGLAGFLDASMRVVEAAHGIFGSFPFADYTSVISFSPHAHWGLEHASSTMIAFGEHAFIDPLHRFRAVRVFAHELFHAWNVCSLKPVELMPPNLKDGSYTELLWVAEGLTRYYEFILSARAKEIPPEDVLSNIINYHRQLTVTPAYARTTVADSSYATFLNHHRYAGMCNTMVDYYDLGMLVAFDLDVELHAAGTSLAEQFAAFYREYVDKGYTNADVAAFMGRVSPEAKALVERETLQPGALQTARSLERLGFSVQDSAVKYLGLALVENTGPVIKDVLENGPAARAGITPQDEIVRVDGFPFHLKSLQFLVRKRDSITLEIKRGHVFHTFTVPVGTRAQIGRVTWTGSDAQAAMVRRLLGRDDLPLTPGREIPLDAYENFHGIVHVI